MTRPTPHWLRTVHGLPLAPVALALACMGATPSFATIFPQEGAVKAGAATISTATLSNGGTALSIAQTTNRAVIDWTSFSIGVSDKVNVMQPSTTSVLLNRVAGGQTSVIAGELRTTLVGTSNTLGGSVYIINPNGVMFSNGSQVSVGGLVASTLDVTAPEGRTSNELFMAFNPATSRAELGFSGTSTSAVVVAPGAKITAGNGTGTTGATVALIGASVSNSGTIEATRGSVNLAAASGVMLTIDPVGDGLTTLRITSPATVNALVYNTDKGSITADGGRVTLQAASTAAETVVRQSGLLRAQSIGIYGGQIVLDASGGSTGNSVSIEGNTTEGKVSQIDVTGSTGNAGGSVTVLAPSLRFSGGGIDTSGSRGGTVSLKAIDALVIGPLTSIVANGSSGQGGNVQLAADSVQGTASVSGSITARGTTYGGHVETRANVLEVNPSTQIDAGGGSGLNGVWVLGSSQNLLITPMVSSMNAGNSNSQVADKPLGVALGSATDVVINNNLLPSNSSPDGVRLMADAQVLKTQGRDATLTVNSSHSVAMGSGSVIRATVGGLEVNFNTDAAGLPLPANVLIAQVSDSGQRIGTIDIENAIIASNGGNIRFYGQSNAVTGRAIGGYSNGEGVLDGITIHAGTLDTCAGGQCLGSGSIMLRGQGGTDNNYYSIVSGAGIVVQGSTLNSGAGAITLDGHGGLAATGVLVGPLFNDTTTVQASAISSRSGDVNLIGSSRNWLADDVASTYSGAASAGVNVKMTTLTTGGNITITGVGADVSLLQASTTFVNAVRYNTEGLGASFAASNGVSISDSNVTAGQGKKLIVSGTAGSRAFDVTGNPVSADTPAIVQSGTDAFGVTVSGTTTNVLQAQGGRIRIDGGLGDVSLQQSMVSTASDTGHGGAIDVIGRNVVVDALDTTARIDSSGATGGGSVDIRGVAAIGVPSSGIVALSAGSQVVANATVSGSGGQIGIVGDNTLRAFGLLQAHGNGTGGNGGAIETSGGAVDLRGAQIDASASTPSGRAGTWLVDPFDVVITHGAGSGNLTTQPVVPLTASIVQDSDINRALNTGTNVTITTGNGGVPTQGNIAFDAGVNINYTAAGPVTLQLDAQRSIRTSGSGVVVQSSGTGGPLNVVFNADANHSGPSVGGGQVSYDGAVYTNGGNVTMNANWLATGANDSAIHLTGIVDTRVGRIDTGVGGNVQLTGQTTTSTANTFSSQSAVWLNGASISTATGNVVVNGSSTNNTGVQIDGTAATQGIATTSGNVFITGLGTDRPAGGDNLLLPSSGVLVTGASIDSVTGNITLRGNVNDTNKTSSISAGLHIVNGARIATAGGGDIELTGSAVNNGIGVALQAGTVSRGDGGALPAINGSRNIVLRASNDGSADAVVIEAPVVAAAVINLRPGGIDATGIAADRVTMPITLGGSTRNGFAVSSAALSRLTAPTVVAGSSAHAADITVVGALTMEGALTLQNGGGANIRLNGAVTAARLGLLSDGLVNQSADAPIMAGVLLARSTSSNIDLQNPLNSVGTMAGSASGSLSYVNANALSIAQATVQGFDAAGNLPQAVLAAPLTAGAVFVRTLTQDLSLDTNVSASGAVDLVAGVRFQNTTDRRIAASVWRIWADSWMGESRGSLAGAGTLPNFYHCAYAGLCTVVLPPADSHFVYAQQPLVTVTVADASRSVGSANPAFVYGVSGLILGDAPSTISGTMQTVATAISPPGTYAISGAFNSPAGYAVRVVPGQLAVTTPTPTPIPIPIPIPDPTPLPASALSRLPLAPLMGDTSNIYTYTFDRNIGHPSICFATSPLDEDRPAQTSDELAREWLRVRLRPNFTSCVNTERRNGCNNF